VALNGSASPVVKPLVNYPDDDDDVMDEKPELVSVKREVDLPESSTRATHDARTAIAHAATRSPPERLSEKRRRDDEDDDELVKLSIGPKRRSSSVSASGAAGVLRRKKSFTLGSNLVAEKGVNNITTVANASGRVSGPKRISISLGTSPLKSSGPDPLSMQSSLHERSSKGNYNGDSGG
jgi:protein phosphatase-4 regulatory subunit 3